MCSLRQAKQLPSGPYSLVRAYHVHGERRDDADDDDGSGAMYSRYITDVLRWCLIDPNSPSVYSILMQL